MGERFPSRSGLDGSGLAVFVFDLQLGNEGRDASLVGRLESEDIFADLEIVGEIDRRGLHPVLIDDNFLIVEEGGSAVVASER